MASSHSRSLPRCFALGTVVLAGALATASCGPDAATSEDPTSRTGGSSGSGTGGSGNGMPGTGGSSGTSGGTSGASGGSTGAGGSSAGTGGSAPVANQIPLPMVVTTNFDNQGWFADPEVEKAFQPGSMVIRQADGTTGPCAACACPDPRQVPEGHLHAAAGLVPPAMGGWVGVFFLTTVLTDRPSATPPVKVGDANWGVSGEPGKNIAPGATKISLPGGRRHRGPGVTFKAGTASDSFVVADKPETLGTTWKRYTLPLTGPTTAPTCSARSPGC